MRRAKNSFHKTQKARQNLPSFLQTRESVLKKILLILLAILIVGSGYVVKVGFLDRPNDPQRFLNEALANSLDTISALSTSEMQIILSDSSSGAGEIILTTVGKTANANAYLPDLDYEINLSGSGEMEGASIEFSASGNLRILDEVFYGKFRQIETASLPSTIAGSIGFANAFADKWYALSFKKLKESDPKIAEVFEEQKSIQLAFRENLRKLLANNDILVAQKTPFCLRRVQPIETILNVDMLTSNEFLEEIETIFRPQISEEEMISELTDEEKERAREIIQAIANNAKITLEIGKKDGVLYGSQVEFNLNFADLGIPELTTGKLKIMATEQISEINKPQTIIAPEEFEEIDPFKLLSDALVKESVEDEVVTILE